MCVCACVCCACIGTTVRMHHIDADKTYKEKASRELHKNVTCYIEQVPEETHHKKQQYGHLPPIFKTFQFSRKRHAGDSWRLRIQTHSNGRASVSDERELTNNSLVRTRRFPGSDGWQRERERERERERVCEIYDIYIYIYIYIEREREREKSRNCYKNIFSEF